MRIIPVLLSSAFLSAAIAPHAMSEEKHLEGATETNEQLIDFYERAGDVCLRNPSRDVQVIVACKSMTIYGLALNERGWCHGKEDQANAFKAWHECEKDSDRFSESSLSRF